MRKYSTELILILLLSFLVLPFFPALSKPNTAQPPIFKIGVVGSSVGHWDGVVATAGFASMYGGQTFETLWQQPVDWSGEYNDMIPMLATDWTITYWPDDEPNSLGWNNTGGIRAMEFTLRDGVTFHDGSDWNATVAKWNIDRQFVTSGNITGTVTDAMLSDEMYKALYGLWLSAWDWAAFETETWNVTKFIGQMASYEGFGTSGGPAWFFYDRYPRLKNVTITEDLASGGKIKLYFNDWSGVLTYVTDFTFMSMDAYQDYFDLPIYGLGGEPGFPQPDVTTGYPTTGFRGHLIGTGPYRFIQHSDVLQQGTMERYDDWWNSTAMQANGWHDIEDIAFVAFPIGESGYSARSTAMVTGTIDYADDGGTLVYADMIADPDIDYYELAAGYFADRNFIELNAVNETYWKDWADLGPSAVNLTDPTYSEYPYLGVFTQLKDIDDVTGQVSVDGINRAMRKALCHAFDYDAYINVIQGGRAVRSGGFLGINNEYYNPSIPLADQDLTVARQTLIDDLFWGPMVAARGLTIANATADWVTVANSNPIYELKFMWDLGTYDIASVFGNSIKDIGCALGGFNGAPDPDLLIQPDLYTAMFDFEGGGIEQIPFFTSHAHATSWPTTNIDSIPSLEYYYKSPGVTYEIFSFSIFPWEALLNSGFHYNQTVDDWLDMLWFSDRVRSQEIYDNLTRHFQTYQYSEIMISHASDGIALNADWQMDSLLGYQYIKYVAGDGDGLPGEPLPEFLVPALIGVGIAVPVVIIGYVLLKRRKRP